ncbi:MAG TPA: nucleotide exchange factor GrpE, partial [Solibacterales bacterium]|nr:nucleotide exchange factor GrpE [Bryobacterales bacterium]
MPSSGGAEDIAPTVDAEKLAALAAERDELREQVLRARAEFDNFRKRTERERLEASEYSAMEAVRQLLPTLDDFVRALKAETADKEYAKGMELIYGRLFETLKKMGLEPIESEGKPFDPHVHHAVE